jgi:hypothetical protein
MVKTQLAEGTEEERGRSGWRTTACEEVRRGLSTASKQAPTQPTLLLLVRIHIVLLSELLALGNKLPSFEVDCLAWSSEGCVMLARRRSYVDDTMDKQTKGLAGLLRRKDAG